MDCKRKVNRICVFSVQQKEYLDEKSSFPIDKHTVLWYNEENIFGGIDYG